MATSGPNSPTAAINLEGSALAGVLNWGNLQKVYATDDGAVPYASCIGQEIAALTRVLYASGFGFQIPETARIDGVKVEVKRSRGSATYPVEDYVVRLSTGEGQGLIRTLADQSADRAATTTTWPTTAEYATYGGETDKWGLGLTAQHVNHPGFGVGIAAQMEAMGSSWGIPSATIDHIRVTVYYSSETDPSIPPTLAIGVPYAASVGPSPPATAANANDGGDQAWSNANNAAVSDNSYATVTNTGQEVSQMLKLTNFSFSVPDNSTIVGVEVAVECKTVSSGVFESVRLYRAGTLAGDNLAGSAAEGPLLPVTTDGTRTFGGSTTLWGLNLTASDVTNSGFGVGIKVGGPGTSSVDRVTIKVYYLPDTFPDWQAFLANASEVYNQAFAANGPSFLRGDIAADYASMYYWDGDDSTLGRLEVPRRSVASDNNWLKIFFWGADSPLDAMGNPVQIRSKRKYRNMLLANAALLWQVRQNENNLGTLLSPGVTAAGSSLITNVANAVNAILAGGTAALNATTSVVITPAMISLSTGWPAGTTWYLGPSRALSTGFTITVTTGGDVGTGPVHIKVSDFSGTTGVTQAVIVAGASNVSGVVHGTLEMDGHLRVFMSGNPAANTTYVFSVIISPQG